MPGTITDEEKWWGKIRRPPSPSTDSDLEQISQPLWPSICPPAKSGLYSVCRSVAIEITWDNKVLSDVTHPMICLIQLRNLVNGCSFSVAPKGWWKHCACLSLRRHHTPQLGKMLGSPWLPPGPEVTLSLWVGGQLVCRRVRNTVCLCVRCAVHPTWMSGNPWNIPLAALKMPVLSFYKTRRFKLCSIMFEHV